MTPLRQSALVLGEEARRAGEGEGDEGEGEKREDDLEGPKGDGEEGCAMGAAWRDGMVGEPEHGVGVNDETSDCQGEGDPCCLGEAVD